MPPGVQSGASGLRRRVASRKLAAKSGAAADPARRRRRADLRALAGVAVLVAVLAQVPLAANRYFYFWDDSAAEFLPVWHRIGDQLLAGNWQPMLPGMWNGGNFAAEALFGLWNPVVLVDAMVTSWSGDLLIASALIKTQFLVLLALGVFALCREYGARRAAAVTVAVALPFSGFTLYFDASSWIAGLMGFTWTTHYWWSARRHARGRLHPVVPLGFGLLAVTTGNPYGVLGLGVVSAALAAECWLKRDRRAARRLAVVVAVPFSLTALVFLPLVLSASVTMRNPTSGITNTGFLVPGVGDLLNLSSPAYLPRVVSWRLPYWTVPVTYFAWFVAPLAPWLRWSALRRDARARAGLGMFGLVYLAGTLGPSQLWLFRWPLRLVEYAYLAVGLLFALALTAAWEPGATTTVRRRRALASAAIVAVGAYLSWASQPNRLATVAAATVLAGLLVALALRVQAVPRRLSAVLVGGTAVVLVFQAFTFPGNLNVTGWWAPHNVATMKARYGGAYQGNTLMVGDPRTDADQTCEQSLKNLGVETLDVFCMSRVDPNVPIDESVGGMAELVREGKTRFISLSECSAESLRRGGAVHPLVSLQMEYSLFSRDAEEQGQLRACNELGMAMMAYAVLGRGILSNQLPKAEELAPHDVRQRLPRFQSVHIDKNLGLRSALEGIARRKNATLAQLAIAWPMARDSAWESLSSRYPVPNRATTSRRMRVRRRLC